MKEQERRLQRQEGSQLTPCPPLLQLWAAPLAAHFDSLLTQVSHSLAPPPQPDPSPATRAAARALSPAAGAPKPLAVSPQLGQAAAAGVGAAPAEWQALRPRSGADAPEPVPEKAPGVGAVPGLPVQLWPLVLELGPEQLAIVTAQAVMNKVLGAQVPDKHFSRRYHGAVPLREVALSVGYAVEDRLRYDGLIRALAQEKSIIKQAAATFRQEEKQVNLGKQAGDLHVPGELNQARPDEEGRRRMVKKMKAQLDALLGLPVKKRSGLIGVLNPSERSRLQGSIDMLLSKERWSTVYAIQ
ncbi:hypothetical protein HaLaN_28951, partial [Haematococcus lacustris]